VGWVGKRIGIAVLVTAVVAVLALVGYDAASGDYANVFGQASADAAVSPVLNSLAAKLRKVHGVSAVNVDFNVLALLTPTIVLTLSTRSTAAATDDGAIDRLVSGVVLHDVNSDPSTLNIVAPNGSRFSQTQFGLSASSLATKIDVWNVLSRVGTPVRELVGWADLTVKITAPGASQTQLKRLIANYPTVLPPLSRLGSNWDVPGLQSDGGVPPKQVLAELSRLVAKFGISPGNSNGFPSSIRVQPLDWSLGDSSLELAGPDDGSSLADADTAARLFVAAGIIPGFAFYTVHDGKAVDYRFHLGRCTGSQAMLPGEIDYATHLRRIGFNLPEGSGPGVCVPLN